MGSGVICHNSGAACDVRKRADADGGATNAATKTGDDVLDVNFGCTVVVVSV